VITKSKVRRVTAVVGCAAGLVLGGMVAAGPAAAAVTPAPTGFARCAAGKFCLFNNGSGTGGICRYTATDLNTRNDNCFLGTNPGFKVRSVWNRTTVTVTLYTRPERVGRVGSVAPAGQGANLSGTYTVGSLTF